MLEQDRRSVCAILLTLMARALLLISPIAKELISFLSLVCQLYYTRLVVTQTSSEMPTGILQQYLQLDFATPHSPPVLFRRLLTHSNKFVVRCSAWPNQSFLAKY
jgi:hypothetical protein